MMGGGLNNSATDIIKATLNGEVGQEALTSSMMEFFGVNP